MMRKAGLLGVALAIAGWAPTTLCAEIYDASLAPLKKLLDQYCPAKRLHVQTPDDIHIEIEVYRDILPKADRVRLDGTPEVENACPETATSISCLNDGYVRAAARLKMLDDLAKSVCQTSITCPAFGECLLTN